MNVNQFCFCSVAVCKHHMRLLDEFGCIGHAVPFETCAITLFGGVIEVICSMIMSVDYIYCDSKHVCQ